MADGRELHEIAKNVSAVLARLDRLQDQHDDDSSILRALETDFATVRTRIEEHTGRIHILEATTTKHSAWSSKIGGVSVGIALTLSVLTSVAALLRTAFH